MFSGRIVGVYTAPAAGVPMVGHADARAIAGVGLDGDRYATAAGRFSDRGDRRDVTLIEREAIVGARHEYDLELGEQETRRNLITEDVPLNHLVGKTFRVGDVVLRGIRLAEPCSYLAGLAERPGISRALVHRGGLRAEIVSDGVIGVGDTVEPTSGD
jgi:MOSC domain-containing protein YiiM